MVAVDASVAVLSSSSELRNLELMHKFSTDTYKSLCTDESSYREWQVVVPQLAFDHDFLLNGILALTALHVASAAELSAAPSYIDTALRYYHMTFAPFQKALSELTPLNCDAVFAHSMVTSIIGIALPRLTVDRNETVSMVETILVALELLQGVSQIYQIGRAWFSSNLVSKYRWQAKEQEEPLDDFDIDAALTRLVMLNDAMVLDAHQRQINQEAISKLRRCFTRFVGSFGNSIDHVLAWLVIVDKEFCVSLKHRHPIPLLILMHWAVLLGQMDGRFWWAIDAGKALVSELLTILHSGDPHWETAKMWPRQKLTAK